MDWMSGMGGILSLTIVISMERFARLRNLSGQVDVPGDPERFPPFGQDVAAGRHETTWKIGGLDELYHNLPSYR
jgi:hypothetical protein